MLEKSLKELRKQLKKTQEEVASDLCLHKSTYKNYELGLREPDFETLKKLADYFHTTIDYLLEHEVPYLINKSEFSSNQLEIIDKIKKLDNDQCKMLISYIDGLNDMKSNNFNKNN